MTLVLALRKLGISEDLQCAEAPCVADMALATYPHQRRTSASYVAVHKKLAFHVHLYPDGRQQVKLLAQHTRGPRGGETQQATAEALQH